MTSVPKHHDLEQSSDDKILDVSVDVNDVPIDIREEYDPALVDEKYLQAKKSTQFWRGTLFQMILFGALSFVGPAMSDAISNLGGGGLSSPYLANLASTLNYALSCGTTLVGGPLINKIGIKWSCLIGTIGFPLGGAGYYVRAKYKIDAFLLFARSLSGITGGFLYVAESTAMLSYPHANDRGLYLGIWSAMRSSGSVLGGAINFATNFTDSSAGGIAWSTYLIFVGFEASGPIWALLLSPTRKVRRSDGSRVPLSPDLSWIREFRALWKHAMQPKTWLMFIPAFYSFFYGGVYGTYLSLHFSTRARALSTLIIPCCTIPMVAVYGKLLDTKRYSQKSRAWFAFLMWAVPQAGALIWTGVEYGKYGKTRTAFDYKLTPGQWAEAYIPYFIVFTTGYWCQLSLYWILGTFSLDVKASARTGGLFRAFETAGQAVAYGINAKAGDPRLPFYVQCALWIVTMPCMWALIKLVPERPSLVDDVVNDEAEEASRQKAIALQG